MDFPSFLLIVSSLPLSRIPSFRSSKPARSNRALEGTFLNINPFVSLLASREAIRHSPDLILRAQAHTVIKNKHYVKGITPQNLSMTLVFLYRHDRSIVD